MSVTLTFRNIEPTEEEHSNILEASEGFTKYFAKIVSIDWEIRSERFLRIVSCRLHSKSGFYRATASSDELTTAVNMIVQKLTRQRRKRKGALQRKRRKPRETSTSRTRSGKDGQ